MQTSNIVNVIENQVTKQTMSMNNDIDKYEQSKKVEMIADTLLEKLGAEQRSRDFLLKAAWHLSEAQIWNNLEQAQKGNNPMGLFIWLCKRSGV